MFVKFECGWSKHHSNSYRFLGEFQTIEEANSDGLVAWTTTEEEWEEVQYNSGSTVHILPKGSPLVPTFDNVLA